MNCSQVTGKLSAYLDDEVDGATSRLIGEHLEGCPKCLEFLRGFREVDTQMVYGLPKIDPSPDFTSRVVSAALRASDVARQETMPFVSRFKHSLMETLEAIFSVFERRGGPSTRTLDEFNDCPPLSMSFIYFRLLDQGSGGH